MNGHPAATEVGGTPPELESCEQPSGIVEPSPPERFQILSLDGGGIRGLFSAAVLAAVEEDLGCRVIDHFDLIAGTSTGGIVAIALGLGLRPREIVKFYLGHAPLVFSNPLRSRSVLQWLVRKYSSAPLEGALRDTFKDRSFGSSEKRLVIPSYNVGEDDVYVFRTPHHARLRRDFRVPAWKVALATSAAPTYFPAHRQIDEMRLVDGGMWANNPAMVALVEAYGTLSIPIDRIAMLSLGTYAEVRARPGRLDWVGLLGWATTAPGILMRATSIGVNNHVKFFLGDRLHRVDVRVPPRDAALDDVGDVPRLIARAAHHSRIVMPTIEGLLTHRAPPYEPLYAERSDGA
jgi:hypothetical protein